MDARLAVLVVALAIAGCQSPSASGEVVDAKKETEKGKMEFLPSDPSKQDQGIKGTKGFGRATPPLAAKPLIMKGDGEPLNFKPVAYFAQNCASCHGVDGAKFDAKAKKGVLAKDFALKVATMTKDKARKPLFGRELAALSTYTQATLADAAYVAWVSKDRYETRPGSKLLVRGRGESKHDKDTEWIVVGLKQGSEILVSHENSKGMKSSPASLMYPAVQSHGEFSLRD